MPLYRCEKCGCIENTALGNFWGKDDSALWPDEFVGKALCSECSPLTYLDGSATEFGIWHGRFEKRSADGMLFDQNGTLWSQDTVDAGRLPNGYRIVGTVGAIPHETTPR